jgi:hypothetical protein
MRGSFTLTAVSEGPGSLETLTHATFFDVKLLQKCLSQRRSYVIGAQLGFSTGAVRKSNANDPGCNSITAANFLAASSVLLMSISPGPAILTSATKIVIVEPGSRVGLRSTSSCCFGSQADMYGATMMSAKGQ